MAGSGYGAFDIQTPTSLLAGAANAADAVTKSQLAQATAPDDVALSRNRVASSGLALADQKTASLAKTTATDESLIANAAALATSADDWDAAMQDLADRGVGEARQFVGRYSEKLKGRVANAYGASSASSALSAMQSDNPTGAGGATSGLADVAGGAGAGVSTGSTPTNFDQQFARATPQQLQASYQHLEKMRSAIDAVSASANPAQTWDEQVAALGHPEWQGKYSAQQLQQLSQETMPLDNYLRGRLTRSGMGVPEAKPAATIDNVGGTLYAVDHTDPTNPTAKPLTPQGKGTFVGLDTEGHGIYYDPVTGKETHGEAVISSARYGGRGGNSVFAAKQTAWLTAHPGDTQGALDYAGGLRGKQLTDQQIQTASVAQATKELSALALAGNPPPDGEGFITSRAQEIATDLRAAPGAGGGGGGAGDVGPIPARALALLKDGKPHPFNNGQVWQMVGGKPKRIK